VFVPPLRRLAGGGGKQRFGVTHGAQGARAAVERKCGVMPGARERELRTCGIALSTRLRAPSQSPIVNSV
jgi:hypothetical protein